MHFGKVDVSLWPDLASRYNIDVGVTSRQIPSYVAFKQGVEVARFPKVVGDSKSIVDDVSKAGKQTLTEALDLPGLYRQAANWEEEAKRKLKKERARSKAE